MNRFSAVIAAALLGLGAYAADVPASPSEFAKAQAALKEKHPEEYAKIEKLAATDLSAALKAFRNVARKYKLMPQREPSQPRDGNFGRHRSGARHGGGRGGNPLSTLAAEGRIRARFPEEYAAVSREMSAAEEKMRSLAERAGVDYPPSLAVQLRLLRNKAPERFTAIEEKAAESPREAMRELMRLAAEENVTLPIMAGRGGMRGGMRGDRPHRGDMDKPEPRRLKNPPMRRLRETFPEEMKRYEDLRQSDPDGAAKLLRELMSKLESDRSGSETKRSDK